LVCARFACAAAVFAVVLLVRRVARGPVAGAGAALAGGAISGLLGAGGYLFQAIGLMRTSAGSSAFLTCVGTVLAALFAWPLLGQRPPGALVQGMLLALAGSFLMSSRAGAGLGPGEAWTLLGAVVYALQIVAVARWAPRADALLLAAVQAGVIALVLWPLAGRAPAQLAALRGPGVWRFAYLVLAGSVVAPLLQVVAQRALSAGRIALLFALEPVFGLGFALTLGGERFAPGWWIGALLILCGVLRTEWSARPAAP
jgi:drug/metabolite transporter (DMT)-like permease